MEILAEDIEIEEEKSERSGRKKNSFWKKLSLVGLGIFSFPLLVPIFVIAILCFVIWIVFSVVAKYVPQLPAASGVPSPSRSPPRLTFSLYHSAPINVIVIASLNFAP